MASWGALFPEWFWSIADGFEKGFIKNFHQQVLGFGDSK